MGIETVTDFNASADRVWRCLTDVEHWPEWTPSMKSVVRIGDEPLAVGSKVRIRQPKLGTMVWTVTEFTHGQSFVWRARRPGLTLVAGHHLSPSGAGTVKLTLTVEQTGWAGRLFEPLTAAMAKRYVRLEAEGHKRFAEATG